MPAATRTSAVGHWAALTSTAVRKRIALTLSPALALFSLLLAPAMPAQAATCAYSDNPTILVTVPTTRTVCARNPGLAGSPLIEIATSPTP